MRNRRCVLLKRPFLYIRGAVDGVVALMIAAAVFGTSLHSVRSIQQLLSLRLSIADAFFGIVFTLLWHYCFATLNLYDNFAFIPNRMRATTKGVLLMSALLITYLEIFHSNMVTGRAVLLSVLALFIYEEIRMAVHVYLLDRIGAREPRRALIVGSGRRASKAWREIRIRYHSSVTLLGFVDDRNLEDVPPDIAGRFVCNINNLGETLLREVVDMIVIAMPIQSCYPLMQRAIHVAENAGVKVFYLEDIYSSQKSNNDPHQTIFRELVPTQEHFLARLAVKRVVDFIGAFVGLLLLWPLLLCVGVAVKLDSEGPAIYRQERYGHHRRLFTLLKFRSMVNESEDLMARLEHVNEAKGPIFEIEEDPCVTQVGRFLRATALDELPQLWNVLKGDMSLVGPRPMSIRDVSQFSEAALMRRFSVLPGMTGLWQVNGRSKIGFDEWVAMDNWYVDAWSLLLDLKILAQTFRVVIKRAGAM